MCKLQVHATVRGWPPAGEVLALQLREQGASALGGQEELLELPRAAAVSHREQEGKVRQLPVHQPVLTLRVCQNEYLIPF